MNATGDIQGLLASSRATIVADGIRLSASEVLERAETFGASLLDQGIQPGDRVALQLPNGLDAVVSLLGAACVGVCTVAVNTRYSTAEADDLIARSGARRVSPPSEMSGTAAPRAPPI